MDYKQISYGAKGSDVKTLQEKLNQNGYTLDVDGIFGAKTQAAVKDYQKKNNLSVDGIVGKNTWGALNSVAANTAPQNTAAPDIAETVDPGYKGYAPSDTVKQAQALLRQQMANKPGEYSSQYADQIQAMLDKMLNREEFRYDLNGDALYRQYADQFSRQGKLAMMDTIGQAAAMTGGYGNSYGQTVGQQTYQGYIQQLNEVMPELYQMAADRYDREGEQMLNQYGMLVSQDEQEYGRHRDQVADYYTELQRLTDDARYVADDEYGKWIDQRNYDYQLDRDAASDQQWAKEFAEAQRQYNEQMAFTKEQWDWEQKQAAKADNTGDNGNKATFANTLWTATGTYDENGNLIFRNSEGKTQAFAPGINPYTGTKHPDAKYGTFSNGYQPNNIGLDNNEKPIMLERTGMSTNIYGKEQTIWQANGKYWLWNGRKNKYEEVDISDLDE